MNSKVKKLLEETLKPYVQYEKDVYEGSRSISVSNDVYNKLISLKEEMEKEFGGTITVKDFSTSLLIVLLNEYCKEDK